MRLRNSGGVGFSRGCRYVPGKVHFAWLHSAALFRSPSMRALIVIAGVLAVSACGNNDQADNTQNIDENLTAENIVSNDVTAIDAVTGDAANMAADVELNSDALGNDANAATTQPMPRPKKSAPRPAAPTPSTIRPPPRPTPNNQAEIIRADRRPCAPEGSGAISAAPSPAGSPRRSPPRARRSPSAGPGNGRNPSPPARPDRSPPAARPA